MSLIPTTARSFALAFAVGACVLGTFSQLSARQPFDPSADSGSSRASARDDRLRAAQSSVEGQQKYDLLLKGGHVIDPRNRLSAVRDVAIADGKVAAVAAGINPAEALKVVDVSGLHVTPGLIDIHVHVYAGTGERSSYAGDNSVYPDGFTLRNGVTTVVDAGCAGWRNFEAFKQHVIDRSKTRVLAFLNIVGNGMRGGKFEQNLDDMEVKPTADMALRHKGLIVGVKTAHYSGPEWAPVERAVEAGTIANVPVMVDFGTNRPERPVSELVTKKLRPGDIYTHLYSGLRNEQLESGEVNPALFEGRKRGVIFDVGHGGGSFLWRIAVPAMKAGFLPDSISTDLHIGSMNAGMKDMLNVMDKFLAMGLSVEDVMLRSTWNPAKQIRREDLGHLSPGASADIGVFRLEKGKFGFVDMYGARLNGTQKFSAELTLRDGRVVYDLNGITRPDWTTLPADYRQTGDAKWDAVTPAPVRRNPGILLAPAVPSAQEKPNFAGRWVVASPASDAGLEETVTQSAATLTTGHASSGHGHRSVYKLDGTESRNVLVSHGQEIVTLSKASWTGDRLTITGDTTYPDGRKRQTTQVWSLDDQGRLVIDFTETGMNPTTTTTRRVYSRR